MNETPIKFNFKVPKRYRREFHLIVPGARHCLRVNRDGALLRSNGVSDPATNGAVLDWIGESMMSVRCELGHP